MTETPAVAVVRDIYHCRDERKPHNSGKSVRVEARVELREAQEKEKENARGTREVAEAFPQLCSELNPGRLPTKNEIIPTERVRIATVVPGYIMSIASPYRYSGGNVNLALRISTSREKKIIRESPIHLSNWKLGRSSNPRSSDPLAVTRMKSVERTTSTSPNRRVLRTDVGAQIFSVVGLATPLH